MKSAKDNATAFRWNRFKFDNFGTDAQPYIPIVEQAFLAGFDLDIEMLESDEAEDRSGDDNGTRPNRWAEWLRSHRDPKENGG